MTGLRSAPRHRSRRAALQVLYAMDLAARSGPAELDESFDRVSAHFDLEAGAQVFARELVCGVDSCRGELDARIAACAENWRVDRMAAVDRNVLRIATFELLRTATPQTIVLDEAIELAHEFGGDRSPGFVNGVLDAIAKELSAAMSGSEES